MILRILERYRKEESGAITAVVGLGMALLLSCAALSVDLGSAYQERVKLQSAVDQAVSAAGQALPANKTVTTQQSIRNKVEDLLEENGYDLSDLDLDYQWDSSSGCWYGLRVTATTTVDYRFAQIMGISAGDVAATAKVTAQVAGASRQTVGIFIEKSVFEAQMADGLVPGKTFEILINGDSKSVTKTTDYGVMEIATAQDVANVGLYGSTPGQLNRFFLTNGYYYYKADGSTAGLAIGDSRPVADTSNYANQAISSLGVRTSRCQETCGSGCTFSTHAHNCARVMVIPVVHIEGRDESVNHQTGTAVVDYFVAMYMKSYTKKQGNCTYITACYIDDYWSEEEIADSFPESLNRYIVCHPTLEE